MQTIIIDLSSESVFFMMQTTKWTATLLIICLHIGSGYMQTNNCGLQKFQCRNGECIVDELLCDGRAHCQDSSDETEAECTKTPCPAYAFRCNYGACINEDSVCNGIQDCVDNSDEMQPQCRVTGNQTTRSTRSTRSCKVPLQPRHGYWKLHRSQCTNKQECEVPQGTKVDIGSHIVYSCNPGYRIRGSINVSCTSKGEWSHIPICIRKSIRKLRKPKRKPIGKRTCVPLTTASTQAICTYKNQQVSCESPVLPDTQASLTCRNSYERAPSLISRNIVRCNENGQWTPQPIRCIPGKPTCVPLTTASTEATCEYRGQQVSCESPALPDTQASLICRNSYEREPSLMSRNIVRCNEKGQWTPQPIRCTPVCGKLPGDVTPLIVNGVTPNVAEFPWHASLYVDEPGEPKKYFCGATIIQENLLITAAHCVYSEVTGQVIDETIYVVTGNIFRDYDFPGHDSRLVKKNQVKHIYTMCDYIGLVGNYVLDIAILELVEPFALSPWLVPVCLNFNSNPNELEVGAFGKVAGFGRTAVGESSGILQALTVPYLPYYQCRYESEIAKNIEYSIVDKFCAGYLNGSSVCDGDSGSGLVFQTEGLWYLRGIVSVSLSTTKNGGNIQCNPKLYSLYTQVSTHIEWIQDVIDALRQNQIYPSCKKKESRQRTDIQEISYSILSRKLSVFLRCPFPVSLETIISKPLEVYDSCSWNIKF